MALRIEGQVFSVDTEWSVEKKRYDTRIAKEGDKTDETDKSIAVLVNYNFICKIWRVYLRRTHREITPNDGQGKILVSLASLVRRRFGEVAKLQPVVAQVRKLDGQEFNNLLCTSNATLDYFNKTKRANVEKVNEYKEKLLKGIELEGVRNEAKFILDRSSLSKLLYKTNFTSQELNESIDVRYKIAPALDLKNSTAKYADTYETACDLFLYQALFKTLFAEEFEINVGFINSPKKYIDTIQDFTQKLLNEKVTRVDVRQQLYVNYIRRNPPQDYLQKATLRS